LKNKGEEDLGAAFSKARKESQKAFHCGFGKKDMSLICKDRGVKG
jgi:hypothetical protein